MLCHKRAYIERLFPPSIHFGNGVSEFSLQSKAESVHLKTFKLGASLVKYRLIYVNGVVVFSKVTKKSIASVMNSFKEFRRDTGQSNEIHYFSI